MPKHAAPMGLMALAATLLLGAAGLASAQGDRVLPPMPVGKPSRPAALAQSTQAQPPVAPIAPAPSPPREWTGEFGLLRPSADAGERDPPGRRQLRKLPRRPVAAGAEAQRLARELRQACRRSHAGPAHHGSDRRAAGVHQGVLGLSRHPGQRRAHRRAAAICSPSTRRCSTRSRRPTASTATSSRRSGASSSNYGTLGGDRPVIRSTATLACIGRRQAYFRDEFLSTLEILHRGDVTPDHLKGSWAGAFGPTQFMPTSFKRFAVDFDGDGRRDVVDLGPRPDRVHRQQSEEGRLGLGLDLGLRGRRAQGLQLHAGRPPQAAHARGVGSGSGCAAPAASRSRIRRTRPICWCPPAMKDRAF